MAMSIEPKFLPYGKDFHVFFFHAKSPNDMEWASNTIKDLESYGFTGGCSGLHFDPSVSLFSNISNTVEKSMVLVIVLSQFSTNSDTFKFCLENTIIYSLQKKLNKVIVPLLINDCEVPQCLMHYEPLATCDDKSKWLPKLLRVLDLENPSSSSGESDEELSETHDKLLKILVEKNFRKQKRFRKICQKSGLSKYICRTGSKEMSKMSISLSTACGIEVLSHTSLVLKWDIFVNVVVNSDDAIVEIEKMKNKVKIKEIKFDFTKVDGDDISKFCKINQRKIIEFVERFLNSCVCFWGKHNKMTCVVSTDIQETDKTQQLIDNIAKSVTLQELQKCPMSSVRHPP